MIFGKISPVLSIATQDSLFNPSPEFITGSYITAVANNYALGANQVNFRVSYGNCEFESGSVVKFNVVHQDNVVLSGSTITTSASSPYLLACSNWLLITSKSGVILLSTYVLNLI